jgi:hypothetical protein
MTNRDHLCDPRVDKVAMVLCCTGDQREDAGDRVRAGVGVADRVAIGVGVAVVALGAAGVRADDIAGQEPRRPGGVVAAAPVGQPGLGVPLLPRPAEFT